MKKSGAKFKGKARTAEQRQNATRRGVMTLCRTIASTIPEGSQVFRTSHAALVCVRCNQALGELEGQGAGAIGMTALADAANVGIALADLGLGAEFLPQLREGSAALSNLAMRRNPLTGIYTAEPGEVDVIRTLVGIHEGQIESEDCTDRLMDAALRVVKLRITELDAQAPGPKAQKRRAQTAANALPRRTGQHIAASAQP